MRKGLLFSIVLGGGLIFLAQNAQSAWTVKRLTWNAGSSGSPAIAIGSNNHIHVVWQDDTPSAYDNSEIYYKKSTNGGSTWMTKRLTWTFYDSGSPAIAVDSNNHIHVVYEDNSTEDAVREIFYKKSTNGGSTWTTKRLTHSSIHNWFPDITIDKNDNIHIVWMRGALMLGGTPNEVYYTKSTDGGATWTTRKLTNNPGYSKYPVIATDSSPKAHIVWRDDTTGAYEIYYKKNTGGFFWITKRLTNTNDTYWLEYEKPDIAIDSKDDIHIVWRQDIGYDSAVAYKRSTDGGVTWSSGLKNLTPTSTFIFQQTPYLYIDSNDNIYVAWYDSEEEPFDNTDIHFKKSADGGITWGPDQRISRSTGGSFGPAMAVDSSGRIHVVYYDDTPGNNEIYYRHN